MGTTALVTSSRLTDDTDKLSSLVVLHDPAIAVTVGNKEEIAAVSHSHRRWGTEMSFIGSGHEGFTQNKVGLRAVTSRNLNGKINLNLGCYCMLVLARNTKNQVWHLCVCVA